MDVRRTALCRGISFFAAAICAVLVSGFAFAQSRVPNIGASGTLRAWPQAGAWQVFLEKTAQGGGLHCVMLTGRAVGGHVEYVGGLSQWPQELYLDLADANKTAVSGNQITLVIDGIKIGTYPITKRAQGGLLYGVGATVPKEQVERVISLFRSGAYAKFATDQFTYTFPLTGAAQSLLNMRECSTEAANLTQSASH